VHYAILKVTSDEESSHREELTSLQQSMVEWYINQSPTMQAYISNLCSEIINSVAVKRQGERKVWFGPIGALQVVGTLIALEFRWRNFNRG
jgi:hypothetical protein